jgi:hypothetical protein
MIIPHPQNPMTSAESVRVPSINSLMKELEMLPVIPTITSPHRMIHYAWKT